MNKRRTRLMAPIVGALALLALLWLAINVGAGPLAQSPGTQSEAAVAGTVPPYIFYQGRLTGADGNPVAQDSTVGPPERLQWVGSPRWARHHDHMASMTSLVSAGGRLFYIFDEGPTAATHPKPRASIC